MKLKVIIKEVNRFKKETGLDYKEVDKIALVTKIQDYLDSDAEIYFRFSDIRKLGINPGYSYKTPLGIYAYNVANIKRKTGAIDILKKIYSKDYSMFSNNFATDKPWLILFVYVGNLRTIDTKTYSDSDAEDDINKMLNLYSEKFDDILMQAEKEGWIDKDFSDNLSKLRKKHKIDYQNIIDRAAPKFSKSSLDPKSLAQEEEILSNYEKEEMIEELDKKYIESLRPYITNAIIAEVDYYIRHLHSKGRTGPLGEMFYFAYNLAKLIEREEESNKHACRWAKILRSIGIGIINDHGMGVIHTNEPAQVLCLDTAKCKVIEYIDTTKILGLRKKTWWKKLKNPYKYKAEEIHNSFTRERAKQKLQQIEAEKEKEKYMGD